MGPEFEVEGAVDSSVVGVKMSWAEVAVSFTDSLARNGIVGDDCAYDCVPTS